MSRRNLRLLLAVMLVSLVCYEKAGTSQRGRYGQMTQTLIEALDHIEREYIEEIDRRKLFEAALSGLTDQLDEYSAYIPPAEYSEFQDNLEQHFGGIGIQLSLDDDGRLTVLSPLVGTPAYEAGVLAGDKILAIDGEDTDGFALEDAVRRLRGRAGQPVTLTVLHPGAEEPKDIKIRRDIIQIDTVLGDLRRSDGSWNYFLNGQQRIGYIRLTSFSEKTVDELRGAIEQLLEQGMQGLILDLRSNPGGLLQSAVEVCDLFIDDGLIVSTRGRDGLKREAFSATSKRTLPDFPMVVLVNRFSASASEIVAACLQDHHRAVIVGEQTWGKGTVQNLIRLENGRSALKLTVASYWRPSGQNIHRRRGATDDDAWGVRPDSGYEVKLDVEQLEKLGRWRRDRDVVQGRGLETPMPMPSADNLAEFDPQLARAIEAMQELLGKHPSALASGAAENGESESDKETAVGTAAANSGDRGQ